MLVISFCGHTLYNIFGPSLFSFHCARLILETKLGCLTFIDEILKTHFYFINFGEFIKCVPRRKGLELFFY